MKKKKRRVGLCLIRLSFIWVEIVIYVELTFAFNSNLVRLRGQEGRFCGEYIGRIRYDKIRYRKWRHSRKTSKAGRYGSQINEKDLLNFCGTENSFPWK